MLTDRSPLAFVAAFVLATGVAAGANAQAHAAPPQSQAQPPTTADTPSTGTSLARIRRLLRESPPTKSPDKSTLLKLDYYIEVVGRAPRIDFFKEFNVGRATAVQYGGMTHAEFLRLTAPPWRKWQ